MSSSEERLSELDAIVLRYVASVLESKLERDELTDDREWVLVLEIIDHVRAVGTTTSATEVRAAVKRLIGDGSLSPGPFFDRLRGRDDRASVDLTDEGLMRTRESRAVIEETAQLRELRVFLGETFRSGFLREERVESRPSGVEQLAAKNVLVAPILILLGRHPSWVVAKLHELLTTWEAEGRIEKRSRTDRTGFSIQGVRATLKAMCDVIPGLEYRVVRGWAEFGWSSDAYPIGYTDAEGDVPRRDLGGVLDAAWGLRDEDPMGKPTDERAAQDRLAGAELKPREVQPFYRRKE